MKIIEKHLPNALVSGVYSLFLFIFFATNARITNDADTGWHMAAGDLIRQLGRVPETDVWAYTTNGYPWFNIAWLFDLAISILRDIIGIEGLVILIAITSALIIATVCDFCTRRNAGGLFTALIVSLSGIMFASGVLLRPQMVTFVCVLIFYILLHWYSKNWKEDDAHANCFKPLLALPFTMILWVNVHAGFIIGFLILGAFGVEALVNKKTHLFRVLVLFGVLCLLAIPLNPLGFDLIPAIYRTLDSVLRPYIQEWFAPKILKDFVITTYLVVFILATGKSKRLGIADNLIAIGMLLLALSEARHKIIWAILACPYIAINLTDWIQNSTELKFIKKLDKTVSDDCKSLKGKIVTFMVAIFLTVGFSVPSIRQIALPAGQEMGWQAEKVPFEEMKFIEKNYADVRFFSHYNFGGYLIYFSNIKVFMDGRTETAYPKKVAKDYVRFINMEYKWDEILNEYEIGGIFITKDDIHNKYFEDLPEWEKVFEGEIGVVYIRAMPSNDSLKTNDK